MADYSVDVIIEIPLNTFIKYEFDTVANKIRCDRILNTSMVYPGNYGYIPDTLAGDGDPLDALILCDYALLPCSIIKCKIIGVLITRDEKGQDEKIILVPDNSVDKNYENIHTIDDISLSLLKKIEHFFRHYKDNEPNKFVIVDNFKNRDIALEIYRGTSRGTSCPPQPPPA